MDELGFNFEDAIAWFPQEQGHPYVLVRLSTQHAAEMSTIMGIPLRRCYITDVALQHAMELHGLTSIEVVQAHLPDAGAVMSGDFGEVLTYFYQSVAELPARAIGPKKWRLKQDRTKPAPKSDVVHFVMPNRPHASAEDVILCAEVKSKATSGNSTPIADAIIDCKKDRTSRLASTLVWLRERAMTTDLGDVDIPLLNRFINAVDHPPATKRFRAVAVICNNLLDAELTLAPDNTDPEFTLVVIGVPELRETYTAVYAAATNSAI
ncbi:DUF1837 domain-containing protein [Pectobacterium carotovorum]|uniref:Anti-bacteriophage protein A/HamA C-terminal domain-containing protein n=1 Tax=Pectobacterium carotovorum subsp. carotovorum TaxID=555 RepID=A0AAI9PFQ3_PECCC|nr:DUF1837 domain-containing protein [Pectobacterium carotovorum]GKX48866.1 hypothetical protein SOASR016_36180 [Pectobacterium carotovorum subsp. carotovorum]GLV71166.1 hypothetical protein Pcaca03_36100 [Pectobacterium carotovorum subsp. carotovorum]